MVLRTEVSLAVFLMALLGGLLLDRVSKEVLQEVREWEKGREESRGVCFMEMVGHTG